MRRREIHSGIRKIRRFIIDHRENWRSGTAGRGAETFCVMGAAWHVLKDPSGTGANKTLGADADRGDVVAQATIKALYEALPEHYKWFEEARVVRPPKPPFEADFSSGDEYEKAYEIWCAAEEKYYDDLDDEKFAQYWTDLESCIFEYNDAQYEVDPIIALLGAAESAVA